MANRTTTLAPTAAAPTVAQANAAAPQPQPQPQAQAAPAATGPVVVAAAQPMATSRVNSGVLPGNALVTFGPQPYNPRPGTRNDNAASWALLVAHLQANGNVGTFADLQKVLAPRNHTGFLAYTIARGWLAHLQPVATQPNAQA